MQLVLSCRFHFGLYDIEVNESQLLRRGSEFKIETMVFVGIMRGHNVKWLHSYRQGCHYECRGLNNLAFSINLAITFDVSESRRPTIISFKKYTL